jgi:hypothetical protein
MKYIVFLARRVNQKEDSSTIREREREREREGGEEELGRK